jgi:integration host factor subunit beta|tara:strand:- start:13148 stop:13513 length:366 start_codon:yes stop_codon:yes gene_type:complete
MTKAELIKKVSKKTNLTKTQAGVVVKTMFQSITDSLGEGNRVVLRGFGSFMIRHRREKIGRNPRTGVTLDVPAKNVPFFRAGKDLRSFVANRGLETSSGLKLEIYDTSINKLEIHPSPKMS